MKNPHPTLALAFSLSLCLTATASAATALIDFGTSDTPSPNNFVLGPNGATIALTDTMAAPTGWTVRVNETGSENSGTAGAAANVSSFPAGLASYEPNALRDSIFANNGTTGTDPRLVLTFGGLIFQHNPLE